MRLGAIVAGVIAYGATLRIAVPIGTDLARGRPARLLIPYGSACAFAVAFGAMWHGDRLGSALDALLSFGAAPLGYLLVIRPSLVLAIRRPFLRSVEAVFGC